MIEYIPYIIIVFFTGYICYGLFLLAQNALLKLKDNIALAFAGKVITRNDDLEKYLLNRFPYYDRLPDPLKIKFLLRVKNFIRNKQFEGREGLEVTDEIKSWVAASAIQLTFGLSKYSLDHFSKIIVYPAAFYNRQNDAMHMGETNTHGIIVLSWKDLQEGFREPTDNFNVGLHEMAHALELQLLLKEDDDTFFGNYYPKFSLIAEEEFENIENERSSFLRNYAGANRHEFFAVCIEYFFESGAEFRQRLPEIYYHLCILLNQDPLHEDGHLEEPLRKTQEELASEITSLVPLFIPQNSMVRLSVHTIYFVFIFSMLVVQGFKGTTELLYFSILIAGVALLLIYFRMNKIILYEKYLVIKNPSGKFTTIYELNDIVAVNLTSDRSGDSLEVVGARHGTIIRRRHSYLAKGSDMNTLLQKLREKKIVVR
ncbi:MAG: zinc-dependent peptidase [Bacteroidetes bacterium]|nr:zinc-dependent peptidase [Bacteroidota bacterium]